MEIAKRLVYNRKAYLLHLLEGDKVAAASCLLTLLEDIAKLDVSDKPPIRLVDLQDKLELP